MALYALKQQKLIHASEARLGVFYRCMDCSCLMKKREGENRRAHFYHIREVSSCRFYHRPKDHLWVQEELQKRFQKGVLEMEKPFLKILRVADLVWEEGKLIFEIQCSYISEKEIKMRVADYKLLGYDIVWLLDERVFNRKKCSQGERCLRQRGAYFFSVRPLEIYDQFEFFDESVRTQRIRRLLVNLEKPFLKRETLDQTFPTQLLDLEAKRYFLGDRLYVSLKSPYLREKIRGLERKKEKQKSWKRRAFQPLIRLLYFYSSFLKKLSSLYRS